MPDSVSLPPALALVIIIVAVLWVVTEIAGRSGKMSPRGKRRRGLQRKDKTASSEQGTLPYRLRDDFLSAAELSLYHLVVDAAPTDTLVLAKVSLGDLFFVHEGNFRARTGWRSRIDRKHVDLLLCDRRTLRPRLGIELDDRSHASEDRRQRDDFVDRAFRAAGLPLLRIPAQVSYNAQELRASIEQMQNTARDIGSGHMAVNATVATTATFLAPAVVPDNEPPLCPRCGVPMVLRTARRGTHVGETFWGCPNYPHCREMRQTGNTDTSM